MLDPHIFGRTYGTRVGAYDNTAGTSMVLTVAEAMAGYSTRNTMVFCLWSGAVSYTHLTLPTIYSV